MIEKIKGIGIVALVAAATALFTLGAANYGASDKNFAQAEVSYESAAAPGVVGVHVKGAVKNPGYYELETGSRVKDAIEIAVAEDDADLDRVNLAAFLVDGEAVVVPTAAAEDDADYAADGDFIAYETDGAAAPRSAVEDAPKNGKINLNTATVRQLKTLDGIGDVLAQRIVDYRDRCGFSSVSDLKKVEGIGDKRYDAIKDRVDLW